MFEQLPLVRLAQQLGDLIPRAVRVARESRMAGSFNAARKWRVGVLLLAIVFSAIGCALDETTEDGLQAFNHGKYREAVRIWRKLALEENPDAQFNLGRIYELGLGVPRNYETAARYYAMAARHGNPYAQGNLAVLYAHGKGVPQDFVQSYAWSTLAAANYAKWARDERAAANRNLNIVASRMTGVELEAARQLVEERLSGADH